MKPVKRIAHIGNHLPRRCGIATFTHDLHAAVRSGRSNLESCVIAMTDPGSSYSYPKAVRFQIRDDIVADYVDAAAALNKGGFDVASLQHEYGIFGGTAGGHIVELLSRLEMPIVTTLHTVLAQPTPAQHAVMERIIGASARMIVMAEKGKELLGTVHGVQASKIDVIAHGIPDVPFLETQHAKAKLGFAGKRVILTFGLLAPSKGIENVIDAMPAIITSCPNAVYIVLGATHPNLVRHEGEAYRGRLVARAEELGVSGHVVFIDQFVDMPMLLDFISMCDVYVTPYLNEAQMTSGTLAYSFGLGKAVVSTPYWHAKELLGDGRGILVPFGDSNAIGAEIAALLANDVRRHAMRKRAYACSRSMTWAQTAKRYLAVFDSVSRSSIDTRRKADTGVVGSLLAQRAGHALPSVQTSYFQSMCDSTGLLQHALHSVPDRSHGYCVDDNARALLVSCALASSGASRLPDILSARFAAFIQHAWNPDTARFRNFMSYDRRWLEDRGSEDSHGRTLWALADCARRDCDLSRRRWATSLFRTALPPIENFRSPRAWAFTLVGLNAYCTLVTGDQTANRLRQILADRLLALLEAVKTRNWYWFEETLAYDNARLSQALIVTGAAVESQPMIDAGLKSLRWLMDIQTTSDGFFRPVGTESFGKLRQQPDRFDQQPVEAAAAISACIAACRVSSDPEWPAGALRAFNWFLGENDLRTPLVDLDTGSCRDGLHADRPNENRGAESVVSYLLGLVEIRQLLTEAATGPAEPTLALIA
ncbi:MAG: glycosyltransferase family 4 protein [Hyphomicrobiaceae bacterium]